MFQRSAFAAVLTTSVLATSRARADVPPPVGPPPAQGQSPGTGGLPPIPPPSGPVTPGQPPTTVPGSDQLPPIPPPDNRPSNPQNPNPNVNNYPVYGWYGDMYQDIYYTSYYFQQVEYWAYNEYYRTGYKEVYDLYIYAGYLRTAMTEYYWSFYDEYHQPKQYGWGYGSRGDFNYGYEYWIRPLYFQFLNYGYKYYHKYSKYKNFDYKNYHNYMYYAGRYYHDYTRCNFGLDGNDTGAKDDTEAFSLEQAAGFDVTQ
jgi:hypothetical protein